MSVQYIQREEDVFNKLGQKDKDLENEIHMKIREENKKEKNAKKHISNMLDIHINPTRNDNIDIIKLKKGLNPDISNKNSLETINGNINIKNNSDFVNSALFNNLWLNINNKNYLHSYYQSPYFLNISQNQLKKIVELESLFKILKECALKAISNPNNKNHYLLNFSRTNFNNSINQYNKNNNLYNNNYFKKIEQQISKERKTEKAEILNNAKNERSNKDTNANGKNIKNIINIELILKGIENRTVVRLHPIPQYYSSFDVSKLIDKYLQIENGKNQRIYKALYVPLSKTIGKNIGFCFIMMVNPKYVIQFYKTFNGVIFNKKKSRKPCTVIWADVQGDDFLKISDDPLRSPIIFKDLIDSK